MARAQSWFIVGGAGFIGSHFVDRLLGEGVPRVTVFDNYSSGSERLLGDRRSDPRLRLVAADVKDLPALKAAMDGHDVVVHLASNPDIARAATEPDIDFREGTVLTQNVVEAMRCTSAKRILYAAGSGVYGDLGEIEAHEDHGPKNPISTYGASKLAGEALISAYSSMFGITGYAFRFGNVVGPRQTHGVGYDFVRSLLADPRALRILGDGTQCKSYIHVDDILDAVFIVHDASPAPFQAYNVATGDYMTVREIADLAVEVAGLPPGSVRYDFTGGPRGWKGDVPVVRLNTDRIRALGWRCRLPTREAMRRSLEALAAAVRASRPARG